MTPDISERLGNMSLIYKRSTPQLRRAQLAARERTRLLLRAALE